jgi:hypothetical protein
MKFEQYINFILESLDNDKKYLILLPGGFKPPTLGHYNLIKAYSDMPQVEKVIVLIGPKERDGITREQSLELLSLYGVDRLPKVSVEKSISNNPMQAAFDFLIDPHMKIDSNLIVGIGASDKGGDEERSYRFVNYFDKNPEKLPVDVQVGVPPIVHASQAGNENISATTLRQAIADNNKQLISQLIPSTVNVDKFISILKR